MKQKLIPKASKKSRKEEQSNADGCGDVLGNGEDSIKKEAGHDVNLKTGKKGKKEKKKKNKKKKVINEAPTSEELVAEDLVGTDSDGAETEVGDHLEMGKKRQEKKKKQRTMEIVEPVPG